MSDASEPFLAQAFLFEPGDAGDAPERRSICEGSLDDCLRAVWALPGVERERAYVATDGWTYVPAELEDMRFDSGWGDTIAD
jgi:hypothetical protein